jgi:hypothetical protein
MTSVEERTRRTSTWNKTIMILFNSLIILRPPTLKALTIISRDGPMSMTPPSKGSEVHVFRNQPQCPSVQHTVYPSVLAIFSSTTTKMTHRILTDNVWLMTFREVRREERRVSSFFRQVPWYLWVLVCFIMYIFFLPILYTCSVLEITFLGSGPDKQEFLIYVSCVF